ncbi:MAG TPA: 1-deoxy-D-xylulose-5-phosphate reductoisomerase [Candidatus Kapabacteria bacterium]|nr:1-deoxy-D-xylulose-5-phosphate reductoisomerase [Candidatus Kapabacteria bacterium]
MKRIAILGSTGSIGVNVLAVADQFPDEITITGLSANANIETLREQVKKYRPKCVVVLDEKTGADFAREMRGAVEVFTGAQGLEELVSRSDVDIVVNALVGFAGLKPTIRAIERGKTIALANKETLVVAGKIITGLLAKHDVKLFPIDSEHNAIWQCLAGEDRSGVKRLILTASGGPFLNKPQGSFESATVEEALNHPNWKMGKKITIDSATLMNKGLEVHEARWLFDMPPERIDVLVHPQSVVHSMVEFEDGSIKAQLGVTDMKLPIQYALLYPHRRKSANGMMNLAALRELTFQSPDRKKFPCLQLAYDALHAEGTAPAVLNAANEVAVEAFLGGKARFGDIPRIVGETLASIAVTEPTLENIVAADAAARQYAANVLHTQCAQVA